jgi:hypothetical protein
VRVEAPVVMRPLEGAVENLAVDVVLSLVGRRVTPAHRPRAPVAFERLVFILG